MWFKFGVEKIVRQKCFHKKPGLYKKKFGFFCFIQIFVLHLQCSLTSWEIKSKKSL